MNGLIDPTAKATELDMLAFEVARNQVGMRLPVEDLLKQLDVPADTFLQYTKNPTFVSRVKAFKKEMEDNGVSFELKAKIQAEEMLKQVWDMVHDDDIPPAVRMRGIENTVRWGKLEPAKDQQSQVGTGFSITFNIPTLPTPPTQMVQGVTIEATEAADG